MIFEERPRRSGSLPVWGGLVVLGVVLLYASCFDRFVYVMEDAGICLRYAQRIASGLGFNYNAGEAVNGVSNPLFVLLQGLLLFLGLEPYGTIEFLAATCLAATAAVLFNTFARFYSVGAAVWALILLLGVDRYTKMSFSGMETPLVFLLVAILFRALHARGPVPAGIALGLLVANKLDGALAPIAFTAVYALTHRRFPWKTALVALLAAAPVFLLLLYQFGSVFPNSMLIKITKHAAMEKLDPGWMHHSLTQGSIRYLYYGAWLSMVWIALSRDLRRSFPILVLQLWFVLHMLAYATVNLGAPYPWYTAVPALLSAILSLFLVHAVGASVLDRTRSGLALTWDPRALPRRALVVPGLLLIGSVLSGRAPLPYGLGATRIPHGLPLDASTNLARQAAGAWLRKHTSGTELFTSFLGLPAFEYRGPFYDHSLLNSAEDPERFRSAAYRLGGAHRPGKAPRSPGRGWNLVAVFEFDDAASSFPLYARSSSEIVTQGLLHLVYPTPVLVRGRSEAASERPTQDPAANGNGGNRLLLPAEGWSHFEISAPEPPTLLFTAFLESSAIAELDPGLSRQLRIVGSGEDLYTGPVGPASHSMAVRLTPTRQVDGRYVFEFYCGPLESGPDPGVRIRLHEVLLRVGAPLEPADFLLLNQRSAARLEYFAERGLPRNMVSR